MKISIGSDHGGFNLKESLKKDFAAVPNLELIDYGTDSETSTDYPLIAQKITQSILSKEASFGILICTTGIGMSIAANKTPGIRAALIHNTDAATFSRKHNDANVICLSGKYHTPYLAKQFIEIFINTPFEAGRHQIRLQEIQQLERH